MEELLSNYLEHCYQALRCVQPAYFHYPTIAGRRKHGERVFAYEFYHQLRRVLPPSDLTLTGEPVKGMRSVNGTGERIIPDFVIHQFATNDSNLIAIEVKSDPRTSLHLLDKDLQKLADMVEGGRHRLNYRKGLLIVINLDLISTLCKMIPDSQKIIDLMKNNERLEIWNIAEPKTERVQAEGTVSLLKLKDSCIKKINFLTVQGLLEEYQAGLSHKKDLYT